MKNIELKNTAADAKAAAKDAKEEADRISKEAMEKINEIKKGQDNVRSNVQKLQKLKEKLESKKITQKGEQYQNLTPGRRLTSSSKATELSPKYKMPPSIWPIIMA